MAVQVARQTNYEKAQEAEMKHTRRGLFGLFAGAAVAPMIPASTVTILKPRSLGITTLQRELDEVVRNAFVPRIQAQIYSQSPSLVSMLSGLRD